MTHEVRFEDILNRELRWPRNGDRLFKESPQWQHNAWVGGPVHYRLVVMMEGYKLAADLAVKRAVSHRPDRDFLVYPIIFNYRQFIELSLKHLIATYGPTVDVQAMWDTHDLERIWKTFVKVLTGYGQEIAEDDTSAVAKIVAEFAKVDPDSFSYRYPVDKRGNAIPTTQDLLDLAALADVMGALGNYFDGCDGYLDSLQSAGP
jgi:hypothetical protein